MPEPKLGWVYLMATPAADLFKIGHSACPSVRKHNVGRGMLICHIIETDCERKAEAYLHGLFSAKRVTGEWFRLTPDDVDRVRRIRRLFAEDLARLARAVEGREGKRQR